MNMNSPMETGGNKIEADRFFEQESRKPEIIQAAIEEYAKTALEELGVAGTYEASVKVGDNDQTRDIPEKFGIGHGDNNEYPPFNFTLTVYNPGKKPGEGYADSRAYWFTEKLEQVSYDRIKEDIATMTGKIVK